MVESRGHWGRAQSAGIASLNQRLFTSAHLNRSEWREAISPSLLVLISKMILRISGSARARWAAVWGWINDAILDEWLGYNESSAVYCKRWIELMSGSDVGDVRGRAGTWGKNRESTIVRSKHSTCSFGGQVGTANWVLPNGLPKCRYQCLVSKIRFHHGILNLILLYLHLPITHSWPQYVILFSGKYKLI